MPIPMTPVQSSNVHAIGYDEESKQLKVQFKGGGKTYTYHNVPPHVHQEALAADSVGSYLNANVKGQYDFS